MQRQLDLQVPSQHSEADREALARRRKRSGKKERKGEEAKREREKSQALFYQQRPELPGGHLKPVTLSQSAAFSAFSGPHFPRFRSGTSSPTLVLLCERDLPHLSAFSPYRVRIADFRENPTDRLYYDRP